MKFIIRCVGSLLIVIGAGCILSAFIVLDGSISLPVFLGGFLYFISGAGLMFYRDK